MAETYVIFDRLRGTYYGPYPAGKAKKIRQEVNYIPSWCMKVWKPVRDHNYGPKATLVQLVPRRLAQRIPLRKDSRRSSYSVNQWEFQKLKKGSILAVRAENKRFDPRRFILAHSNVKLELVDEDGKAIIEIPLPDLHSLWDKNPLAVECFYDDNARPISAFRRWLTRELRYSWNRHNDNLHKQGRELRRLFDSYPDRLKWSSKLRRKSKIKVDSLPIYYYPELKKEFLTLPV